jgi:enamine deaminase RidA (YjgF/YER057c/UK114 family)
MPAQTPVSPELMKVIAARCGSCEEFHVMAVPPAGVAGAPGQADAVYGEIARALVPHRPVRIIAERAFGELAAKDAVLAARSKALAAAGISAEGPVTYVECAPCERPGLAGVQLTALRESDTLLIVPLREGTCVAGFAVSDGPIHRVWLSAVTGLDRPAASPGDEAERMILRAASLLCAAGQTYRNVVCTRIFVRRLLDWYGEFNAARNRRYAELGVRRDDGPSVLPASTGIQGKISDACECAMDVFALRVDGGETIPFRVLHNPRQNEAIEYGSAFSRGASVDLPGSKVVIVSGTAAIDESGHTVHVGDPAKQAARTLENFETVLKVGGATPAQLFQAVWYCKDPEYAPVVRAEMRKRSWPVLPIPVVIADVCRHDLLVEIDGAAVVT